MQVGRTENAHPEMARISRLNEERMTERTANPSGKQHLLRIVLHQFQSRR